jgi:hypothetical protein
MRKSNKAKGQKFENKVQKTIASGGLWFNKADLRSGAYSIECKFTDKSSYRVSLEVLEKLWNESLTAGKLPLLEIGIRRNDNQIFKIQGLVTLENLKK